MAIGEYIRSVSATVDDSVQTRTVVVEAVRIPTAADSVDFDLANEPRPNPKEFLHCLLHLLICRALPPMVDTAMKFASDSASAHQQEPIDNKYDAWRHALWSALLTYEFGETEAKTIGDNHESGEIDSPDPVKHNSSCMDLTNNARGRALALAHMPKPSLALIEQYVMQDQGLAIAPFNCPNTKPW